jgi:LPXTG-motif cell wall-anchored protein
VVLVRKFFTLTRGPTGRTRMATVLAAVGALVMSGGVVMLGASTAAADPDACVPQPAYTETIEHPAVTHVEEVTVTDSAAWTETVVDRAAYDERVLDHVQHYSLAEGSWKYQFNPGFPDTGDPEGKIRWQENAEQEPHTQGQGQPATWVDVEGKGLHYTGEPGHSNWFYLEEIFTTVNHDAVTHTVDHPAVTHQETRTVVDQPAWTEKIDHPAGPCPDQPGTVVNPLNEERMSCDMGVEQREGTQTTTYVWNASTRTYDPVVGEEIWGEWAQVRDLTTAESLELECVAGEESIPPKPHKTRPASPQPEAKPPVVLGTEAAVPTGVEAGLASLPNTGASGHNLLAQLMVGSGLVLLVAGGWLGFGRREYGGHQL